MERKNTDLAWCAGFFEARGDIRHGATISAYLHGSLDLLKEFQSIMGVGKIDETYGKFILILNQDEVTTMWPILKPYFVRSKLIRSFTQ